MDLESLGSRNPIRFEPNVIERVPTAMDEECEYSGLTKKKRAKRSERASGAVEVQSWFG